MNDTKTDYPISPPPELVREWNEAAIGTHFPPYGYSEYIATRAARWGAEQRLEAVCEYITKEGRWFAVPEFRLAQLRKAMNPKPPSLVEQALDELQNHQRELRAFGMGFCASTLIAALERLQQLEQENNGKV